MTEDGRRAHVGWWARQEAPDDDVVDNVRGFARLALEIAEEAEAEVERLEGSGRFTAEGLREEARPVALRALRELSELQQDRAPHADRWVEEAQEELRPAFDRPDNGDVAGVLRAELRDREVRDLLRAMEPAVRRRTALQAAREGDGPVLRAVLEAPPLLSALDGEALEEVRRVAFEEANPAAFARVEELEREAEMMGRAFRVARERIGELPGVEEVASEPEETAGEEGVSAWTS